MEWRRKRRGRREEEEEEEEEEKGGGGGTGDHLYYQDSCSLGGDFLHFFHGRHGGGGSLCSGWDHLLQEPRSS